jgi:predicted nuclease of predicted toxin-antitoxin system
MRFLANENFPGTAIQVLEKLGHDVTWVRITAPATSDDDVLAWAIREERILLTFDKDFGELARASALPKTCGVVLFRTPMAKPGAVGQRIAELIAARDDWAGHLAVVEPGRVRMRPLTSVTA